MAIIKRVASKATPTKIVNYLKDKEKTDEKLISGKDCSPENVVEEFNSTQELYNKTNGVRYHHVVQSFSPDDNITPEKAHELGNELAEKQFKKHEVFVVTHKDKSHIHNHLVVNSVSFEDGKKYKASNKSLWEIKRESNRSCEREGLKTIDLNKKAPERVTSGELRMLLRGNIPWKDELKQCIDLAKEKTIDLKDFRKYLKDNFEIETRVTNKTISYKHPDKERAIRGKRLGNLYAKGELENELTGKEKTIIRGESRNQERRTESVEGLSGGNNRTEQIDAELHKGSYERGYDKKSDSGSRTNGHKEYESRDPREDVLDIGKAKEHSTRLRKQVSSAYGEWKKRNDQQQSKDNKSNGEYRNITGKQHESHEVEDGPKLKGLREQDIEIDR